MHSKLMPQCPKRPVRTARAVSMVVEQLEGRRLLASSIFDHAVFAAAPTLGTQTMTRAPLSVQSTGGARLLATVPTVTGSNPGNNATDVPRFSPITLQIELSTAGEGIDPATLNTDNVKLNRTSDNQFVNANINTDAGGAAITIQPTAMLAAETSYTVRVTSGLKTTGGDSFAPFTMTFRTGSQVPAQDPNVAFIKSNQSASTGRQYSALAWGPDNKLYAGTLEGNIVRFNVNTSGTLSSPQVISTVNSNNSQTRFIIGLEFDPTATAANPVLWVSHSVATDLTKAEAPDWSSKISILTGANLQNYTDAVVDLPRSVRDHLTNQIKFGPDGALYWSQPSMNAMGAPDAAWIRSDNELSGAVLRLDPSKLPNSPLSARTASGGGSYNPYAANAPITIYATGVRNAYDFVWHSNGHLYMPANGSAAGGDTPAGPGGVPAAMTNVQETMHDYVFDVRPGKYYGQPNLTRNQRILNGGNPTAGVDRNEVRSYPVGTAADANYAYSAFDFGQNYSPTGVIEYKNTTAFGGRLAGRMIVMRYSGGDDAYILTPTASPDTLSGINGVNMDGFNDPTDVIEDPRTGNLYVAQLGTVNSGQPRNLITLLKPDTPPVLDRIQLINADGGYSLGALKAKSTFNLADKETRNLSIRVLATGATRVVIDLDGVVQDETDAPFALKGNNPDGSYIPWTPTPGMKTLTITPYNANGTPGATSQLVFWVTDQTRPFNANVNFQPVDTPRFNTWKQDWGRLYGARGNGLTMGWNKAAYNFAYDNNNPASPDQRFDTGIKPGGRSWSIAVPNGNYAVFLMGGNASSPVGTYNIYVEGTQTLVGTTSAAKPWIGKSVVVNVTDNMLTVAPASGNKNHSLAFIQIASI